MDSLEHGANFSSPNADITIISLQWGTAESAFRLGLSDGSSFFIPFSFYKASSHYVGAVLEPEEIEELQTAEQEFLVRRKALDLLTRREHSLQELKLKLCQRGFGQDLAEKVCSQLQEQDLVNDRRFAGIYAGSRLRRKPEGPLVMERRLRQKGISRDISADILRELYTPETMDEALKSCLDKIKRKKSELSSEELRTMLAKKGFSYQDIAFFFEKYDF
ncbi:regulatory protein RecX [Marispirochaeta sp.]|jgi:regulatory protein|uniref:regulatory protein RecX n=1 Tax=Marispirochaeta sp. TaxID=2038653 RepID=UPI0029C6C5E4|nr:regulatory protein RecX [Marispirochaeta sp.]